MFYNLNSMCQTLFVFTVSKMSYNMIYRTNDSSSKIITILMCAFGSCNIWSLLSQIKFNNNNNDTELLITEDEDRINDYTKRSDISDVLNDCDRLLGNSASLGENIEV